MREGGSVGFVASLKPRISLRIAAWQFLQAFIALSHRRSTSEETP
jgi:hypothetical protein